MTTVNPHRERLLEAARLQPPRRRPRLAGGLAVALALLPMLGVLALWASVSPAPASRPAEVSGWVLVGMAGFAALVTWLVRPPRPSMLPPPTSRLVAIVVGVPLVVAAWLLAWHAAYDDPFTRVGFRCFALTMAAAPWPFLALLAVLPRFVPDRVRLLGGALGAVAGAWAALIVELWCPLAEPSHVLVGHVLPLVVLTALGALAGARLLQRRQA
jgi:hypothetical protein